MARPGRRRPTGFGIVLDAVRAGVRLRRRLRGPQRPSWDEAYEVWATVLQGYARWSTALPLSVQRRAAEAFVARAHPGLRAEPVMAGGRPAEWLTSDGCDPSRVLLYLHGGGYSIGSLRSHREPVSRLCAESGVRGLLVDYRLAPEHRFPAQLVDAKAAYRWLLDAGIDPSRIVVAGESAGGGLTLSLLVSLRDEGAPLPAAAICVSPWIDLEMRGASMTYNARFDYVSREVLEVYARRFVARSERRDPLAAPVHADLRGLPPMLVLAGGAEVLLDDARALTARARDAGVDVRLEIEDDMIHAWPLFSGMPSARRAIERMAAYVRGRLDGGERAHLAQRNPIP